MITPSLNYSKNLSGSPITRCPSTGFSRFIYFKFGKLFSTNIVFPDCREFIKNTTENLLNISISLVPEDVNGDICHSGGDKL